MKLNPKNLARLGGGTLLTGGAVIVGFAVGFGMGQSTRKVAPSHVKTDFSDGVVTVEADVYGTVKTGVKDYFGLR